MQTAKNQVSTIPSASRPPAPLSIELDIALSRAANRVDNGKIPEGALPSGARLALEARLREFDGALRPAAPDRIRSIVGSLSTMPTRVEDDPAKQRFMVEQFVSICSDLPEWALAKAAMAFLRHEVGSGFFPQAGELRKHALRFTGPLEANRQKIAGVLAARVIPDAATARERVKEGFRSLADSLPEGPRKRPKEITPAQAETNLAALKEKYAANPVGDCSDLMRKESA